MLHFYGIQKHLESLSDNPGIFLNYDYLYLKLAFVKHQ